LAFHGSPRTTSSPGRIRHGNSMLRVAIGIYRLVPASNC
jgi:hypothetical protein